MSIKTLADQDLPDGWHSCPECEGMGTAYHNGPTCSCCHGESIVAEARYQQWRAVMGAFDRWRAGAFDRPVREVR